MERIVVGMSGASGAILGIRLLQFFSDSEFETHLVISSSAERTINLETNWNIDSHFPNLNVRPPSSPQCRRRYLAWHALHWYIGS